ncbi:MAG TPA: T9SS type A sorting domain-containing protein, partial [Candidatus Kapabacteria bacterium]|nr:T9SS type A sorting domain-containing protein [Candidatus Kapabacteria bacterium]
DSGNTLSERRGTPAEAASVCGDWTDSLHVYLAFVQAEPNFSNDQQFPIAVTSDGGYDWDYIFADTVSRNLHYQQVACLRGTPYAIALARDSLAIVSFYYTSDWGATWKPNYSYPALIKQIALVAPNEIWAIANPSHGTDSLHTQFILHSKDTGHTWSVDSTTLVGFRALNLTFSDPGHGWIAMNKLAHADTIGTPIHYEWDENDSLLYVSRYNTPLASVSQQEAKAQERDGIQLYPNPATTKLNIVSSYSSGTIYLFDILGRESLSAPLPASGNATLDVSHLPRGVYSIVQEQRGIRSAMGKVLISGE